MQAVQILVVFHVVFGALWFGGPLLVGSIVKSAAPHGRAAFHAATTVAARAGTLAVVGNLGALATGVGLIFMKYGGMKGLPVRFHIALGLSLVGAAVVLGLLKPTLGKLVSASAADGYDPSAARPSVKRLAMATGINHLVWLVCLVLMFAA